MSDEKAGGWRAVVRALLRPYTVMPSMVVLVLLVPTYLVIADLVQQRGEAMELPTFIDAWVPLSAPWSLVYGIGYFFLIVAPLLVLQDEGLIRRTMRAYLFVWLVSFAAFLVWPTRAPRPPSVEGEGFAVWGLSFLYGADPPYNCFPSLHVAHCFVSAFALLRMHARLGVGSLVLATVVGLSTLFTKQHWAMDALAGAGLAVLSHWLFLRPFPRDAVPSSQRAVAPGLAAVAALLVALVAVAFGAAYLLGVEPDPVIR